MSKTQFSKSNNWHFWTNGVEEKSFKNFETPPEGWYLGRKPFSKETKERASLSAKARGSNNKGKKLSEEACRHMSEAKQRFLKNNPDWKSPTQWQKGCKSWNKGIPMREETRKKLSIAKTGLLLSKEQKKIKAEKEKFTKDRNRSWNTSKPEEMLYYVLTSYFPETKIKRQYRDERYPFNCDFYIEDIDLFIELNYHWTHGKHPFDKNSKEDLDKAASWEVKNTPFYKTAIGVWTVRDPLKVQTANRNNLNYISIYSNEDLHRLILKLNYLLNLKKQEKFNISTEQLGRNLASDNQYAKEFNL